MTIAEAIKTLSTTYRALDSVAQTLIVDANELYAALAKAKDDTVEKLCLQHLAKFNPATTKED